MSILLIKIDCLHKSKQGQKSARGWMAMMSGYTHETDAHLSVYVRVDIIKMCSANH